MLQLAALSEPDAPPEPTFLYNRANMLEYLGRFHESREMFLRCVAEARRAGNRDRITMAFVGLASTSLELGDLGAAGGYLADAVTNLSAEAAPMPREIMRLQIVRGSFALRQGRIEAARTDLDAAIATGKNVYWKIRALILRAEADLNVNNLDAAQADAKLALSLAQSAQGTVPFSNRTGLAWLMSGRIMAKRGDDAGAREAFQAAIDNLSNTVDADHPKLVLARQLAHQ
jgi:tetratricopeptide (TPR) repeat protein